MYYNYGYIFEYSIKELEKLPHISHILIIQGRVSFVATVISDINLLEVSEDPFQSRKVPMDEGQQIKLGFKVKVRLIIFGRNNI